MTQIPSNIIKCVNCIKICLLVGKKMYYNKVTDLKPCGTLYIIEFIYKFIYDLWWKHVDNASYWMALQDANHQITVLR